MLGRLLRKRFGSARTGASRAAGPGTAGDERFMRRALELASAAAEMGETPVGAVVVRTETGDVLAEAHNLRESENDPAGHAELLAMRAAAKAIGDWRLSDCTLYVTLEPCPMCAGMIVQARVGRVVYGAKDPKAGAVDSLYRICSDERLNHRIEPVGGVLAEESSALLKQFFRGLRAKRK